MATRQKRHELEVQPGRGLGSILFGMSVTSVEKILGRAANASIFDGGDSWTILLQYRGIGMFFDQSDDFRLGMIEVDRRSRCKLFEEPLFPRTREQVLSLLKSHLRDSDLREIEVRTNKDLEESFIRVRSIGTTFYFDLRDNLTEVSWSVIINQNDELIWPRDTQNHDH
jgi:hypothetical protein